ncbi:MAG: hypothetical protein PHV43_01705 [Candidatus Colwellbacteria bacterium]|nr:hypothetical protein [Candidatus Colwellbacteria bacterium]
MNKYLVVALVVIVFGAVGVLSYRFFLSGPEDTWLCENGEWIKHGNPSASMPEEECEEEGVRNDEAVNTWPIYTNESFGITFVYPEGAEVVPPNGESNEFFILYPKDLEDPAIVLAEINPLIIGQNMYVYDGSGDASALSKAFSEGGIRGVANTSRETNLGDYNPNIENDFVGALREFNISSGEAWGFEVGGDFTYGFVSTADGTIIETRSYVVFVSNGQSVFRVIVPKDSLESLQILESLVV